MCGRYSNDLPRDVVRGWFRLSGEVPDLPARFNIAPTQPIPIIRRASDGGRELALVRWGLVPHWSPGPREQKSQLINARVETVATKPAFRDAFRRRRCVIPARAFYEWRLEGRGKQPYAITRRDGEPMAFAGLWEHWRGLGETIESAAIIVGPANATVAPIHDRMPVILLDPAAIDRWLDPEMTAPELTTLTAPCPAESLTAFPVSRRVNSPANDGPDLLDLLQATDTTQS